MVEARLKNDEVECEAMLNNLARPQKRGDTWIVRRKMYVELEEQQDEINLIDIMFMYKLANKIWAALYGHEGTEKQRMV